MTDNNILMKAEKLAKSKDYELAIDCCNEYLTCFPSDREGLRLLAFINCLKRDYSRSINVISDVIEQCKEKPEPCDYFNRGKWLLESRSYEEAASDFSQVIGLCERYKDNYYLESAYLFHATALFELKLTDKALNNLIHVSDDCSGFALGNILSKAELMDRLKP